MTAKFQMIGNAVILDRPDKVAFLSSRRISPADVLKCYEWAEKVRDTEQCVISGFQSPLEKVVLARSLWKTVPEELREPVGQGRLLIVSPVAAARASAATASARNRWILANCTSLVLGSLDPNGNLAKLVSTFSSNYVTCLQDIPSGQESL